jgi:hypothetical protein
MVHLFTSIGSFGGPSSGVVEVAASNSAETARVQELIEMRHLLQTY